MVARGRFATAPTFWRKKSRGQAVGVDLEGPKGGETFPLSRFAVVTGLFSVAGIGIAVACSLERSPAERYVRTAATLTAISLVPPLLSAAKPATVTADFLGIHLAAATVVIFTLARSLRNRTIDPDRRIREIFRPHALLAGQHWVL